MEANDLGLGDHVCLVLLCGELRHGWALTSELAPDGPLGRIWTLSRALTYRAIDRLLDAGLLVDAGTEPGRGRGRRLLDPTETGRATADAWLASPVTRLRDLRTELLLKLELRGRAGLPLASFVEAQVAALGPTLDRLERDPITGDVVALWRREQARATRRFLDALRATDRSDDDASGGSTHGSSGPDESGLRLSARNQLAATISAIELGEQLVTVTADVEAGAQMSAVITRAALDELGLVEGDRILMISKAADTVVGVRAATPG